MSTDPELFRALGALAEPPDPAHAPIAQALGLPGRADAAEHTGLFVLQLVPYASVYAGAEGMLGGEAADRVAGFWRALRVTPPPEPDHLTTLLALYAALAEQERDESDPARRALRREARRALLWEHLLTWLVAYAQAVRDTAGPYYGRWARVLGDALLAEAAALPPPELPPAHLRAAPAMPGDDGDLGELVRALLTPVRSGLILTGHDLARAARDTGLAPRLGERAFILRALFDQDPEATAAWLARQAERWARRHTRAEDRLGDVARHWRTRAEHTRTLMLRAHSYLAKEEPAHAARP